MSATATSTRQRRGVVPHPRDAFSPGDPDAKKRMGYRFAGMAVGGAPSRRPCILGGGALLLLVLVLATGGGDGGGRLRIKGLVGGGWKMVDARTKGEAGAEAEAGAAREKPDKMAGVSKGGEAGDEAEAGAAREKAQPDFPDNCFWGCYLANYADLEKGLAHNKEAALQHYLKNGIKERRECLCIFPPECSARCYVDNYPDLQQNLPHALEHYMAHGVKERRDCSCKGGEKAVGCVDDPKWQRMDDDPNHDCGFVAQLPENRCVWGGKDGRPASQACRKSCGSCGS